MSNINNTKEQYELNRELAQMLKGGVIMDVTNAEQAKTAEAAGACAVMALERIPADIRAAGGAHILLDHMEPEAVLLSRKVHLHVLPQLPRSRS